jgi:hypothetical protein
MIEGHQSRNIARSARFGNGRNGIYHLQVELGILSVHEEFEIVSVDTADIGSIDADVWTLDPRKSRRDTTRRLDRIAR